MTFIILCQKKMPTKCSSHDMRGKKRNARMKDYVVVRGFCVHNYESNDSHSRPQSRLSVRFV